MKIKPVEAWGILSSNGNLHKIAYFTKANAIFMSQVGYDKVIRVTISVKEKKKCAAKAVKLALEKYHTEIGG